MQDELLAVKASARTAAKASSAESLGTAIGSRNASFSMMPCGSSRHAMAFPSGKWSCAAAAS